MINQIISWLKNIKLFISLFVIFIIVISILLVLASKIIDKLSIKNNEFKNKITDLEKKIGKANVFYSEEIKLRELAIGEISDELNRQIERNKELIIAYGKLEVKYNAKPVISKIQIKTIGEEGISIDPKNLYTLEEDRYKKIIFLPWSYQDFRITMNGDIVSQTIEYSLHQKFRGQIIESIDKNNRPQFYINLFELDDNNNIIDRLEVEDFTVIKSTEINRMMWWNPKIDIGTGLAINSNLDFGYTLDVGISTSAFGKTKDDLKWRFARFGFGVMNKNFSINFNPIMYNIGNKIPVISNLYISPQVGYTFTNQTVFSGLGMSINF